MMTDRRTFISAVTAALGGSLFAASGKAKTVLLQSAWDTINIGDIGHTPGTLRILEEHLPQVNVVLWAMKLDERVEAMLRRRFPKVNIVRGSLKGTTLADKEVQQAIAYCDLFIRNSGMGQGTDYMEYCHKLGKPYGLYGQSFFPSMVEGKGAAERIALLDAAAFIYCRETKTLNILKNAGVKTPVLEFGPDGCFGIDVRDDERGLATLKKLGLEDRQFITLQLRTHTAKHEGVDNPPLNPLHPTPEMIADDERRAAKYRDLVTRWVQKTGKKVLIAPEVKKEMVHNKRLIFDLLPPEIQTNVVNLEEFWNADEAASVFARAHTIVCHEPHSPIIALANGTPIIHTYSEFHSPKCWMFKDIGLNEWLLEFDETPVETMEETLLTIDADYPAALAKVKKAMEYVHQRQADTMKTVQQSMA
ncbi:Polysaccharide pyruvyl transferase family protein WcaK [Prosthecobacter debontii]|uniref:Polysaccharide pyruvyl transferase family protein WcaK n=1 Tax=Prosthecobacter debontii TaxID=48467 RepID=A0A1T4YHC7_9BACT|nr:polysaccharide pyruvyl transferase family protein [Prosthecobacter debontii]SKB00968.1 Polysaccharide pyruvyl transferase family protein WcaK [Prosthecobacter debontii]